MNFTPIPSGREGHNYTHMQYIHLPFSFLFSFYLLSFLPYAIPVFLLSFLPSVLPYYYAQYNDITLV